MTVLIYNQTIALCSDAHLSSDMPLCASSQILWPYSKGKLE